MATDSSLLPRLTRLTDIAAAVVVIVVVVAAAAAVAVVIVAKSAIVFKQQASFLVRPCRREAFDILVLADDFYPESRCKSAGLSQKCFLSATTCQVKPVLDRRKEAYQRFIVVKFSGA